MPVAAHCLLILQIIGLWSLLLTHLRHEPKSGSVAQSGKQRWCGLLGEVVVSSPSRHNPRFLKAPGEGADVRRGVSSCGNLKQSSRCVVLVPYTYGDGILTRIVTRRRPGGICRYLPLHSSVAPMSHKSMSGSSISGQLRSSCKRVEGRGYDGAVRFEYDSRPPAQQLCRY